MAIDVAQQISGRGFAIITGGGPGIMEAANRGAQAVNGASCGLAIDLPFELDLNGFIDPQIPLALSLFLCAQSDVYPLCTRLCFFARRFWNTR